MGSHRKPRTGILESPAARRGVLGVSTAAALASATLLAQSARADDPPTIEEQRERAETAAKRAAEVSDRVDELYHEAGVATQRFNAAEEAVEAQQEHVDQLLDRSARATERVNEARRVLGTFAAAQYRAGAGGLSETATLLLAGDPQSFFDHRHTLDRLTARQEQALTDFTTRQERAEEQRAEAAEALTDLTDREAELQEQKEAVQQKLATARELLDSLSAEEEAALAKLKRMKREAAERRERARREREARERAEQEQEAQEQEAQEDTPEGPVQGGDSYAAKAREAIDFAEDQLGKPYVWGAAGPNSYDCSGLTQAAWLAAGVELPRVTWDQVEIGIRVDRSELQPGDLVFFYDDISHVGLYIGGGEMIHAPKPGDVVKVESIDYMPWYGAVRPA